MTLHSHTGTFRIAAACISPEVCSEPARTTQHVVLPSGGVVGNHADVYKRQRLACSMRNAVRALWVAGDHVWNACLGSGSIIG